MINDVINNKYRNNLIKKTKQPGHNDQAVFKWALKINYETTTPLKESVFGVLLSLVVTLTVFINAPGFAAL